MGSLWEKHWCRNVLFAYGILGTVEITWVMLAVQWNMGSGGYPWSEWVSRYIWWTVCLRCQFGVMGWRQGCREVGSATEMRDCLLMQRDGSCGSGPQCLRQIDSPWTHRCLMDEMRLDAVHLSCCSYNILHPSSCSKSTPPPGCCQPHPAADDADAAAAASHK